MTKLSMALYEQRLFHFEISGTWGKDTKRPTKFGNSKN